MACTRHAESINSACDVMICNDEVQIDNVLDAERAARMLD